MEHFKMPYRAFGHSETKAGEVLLGNMRKEIFDNLDWKTKRLGKQAFDFYRNPISSDKEIFPVFVQISEFSEKGLDFVEVYSKLKEKYEKRKT